MMPPDPTPTAIGLLLVAMALAALATVFATWLLLAIWLA